MTIATSPLFELPPAWRNLSAVSLEHVAMLVGNVDPDAALHLPSEMVRTASARRMLLESLDAAYMSLRDMGTGNLFDPDQHLYSDSAASGSDGSESDITNGAVALKEQAEVDDTHVDGGVFWEEEPPEYIDLESVAVLSARCWIPNELLKAVAAHNDSFLTGASFGLADDRRIATMLEHWDESPISRWYETKDVTALTTDSATIVRLKRHFQPRGALLDEAGDAAGNAPSHAPESAPSPISVSHADGIFWLRKFAEEFECDRVELLALAIEIHVEHGVEARGTNALSAAEIERELATRAANSSNERAREYVAYVVNPRQHQRKTERKAVVPVLTLKKPTRRY
jgi:hypothetical protein